MPSPSAEAVARALLIASAREAARVARGDPGPLGLHTLAMMIACPACGAGARTACGSGGRRRRRPVMVRPDIGASIRMCIKRVHAAAAAAPLE